VHVKKPKPELKQQRKLKGCNRNIIWACPVSKHQVRTLNHG